MGVILQECVLYCKLHPFYLRIILCHDFEQKSMFLRLIFSFKMLIFIAKSLYKKVHILDKIYLKDKINSHSESKFYVCEKKGILFMKTNQSTKNIEKKNISKKKILIISFSIILVLALIVFVVIYISNTSKTEKTQILEKDFAATIDTILGKSENNRNETCISGMVAVTEDSFRIFDNRELEEKISDDIQYQIKSVEIDGNNAMATIHWIGPDIYGYLQQSIKDGKHFENTNEIFDFILSAELDKDTPKLELTTNCCFEYIDEHWYWIPSKDVLNLMSGNLYQYFENNGYTTENKTEGGR